MRQIQTTEFNEFYDQYPNKEYIYQLIMDSNKDELNQLVKQHKYGPLYSQSLRTLRIKARNKGIANWYILTKPALVKLLS